MHGWNCPKCYRVNKPFSEMCGCGYEPAKGGVDPVRAGLACPMCNQRRESATLKVCPCGYEFATGEFVEGSSGYEAAYVGFRAFLRQHVGKLLIAAFVVPIPLRVAGQTGGTVEPSLFADGLAVILILLAIAGYVMRRKWLV